MTLVTQAEFARRKQVSRAAVTQWAHEKRLIFSGKLIDLEATEAAMIPNSRHRSKRRIPAAAEVKLAAETVKSDPALNTAELIQPPLDDYPASMSAMTTGCASDLAVILLRSGMPQDRVAALVDEWLTVARRGATELLEDDLNPPPGFNRWADHPGFQGSWLSGTGWQELADLAALPAAGA